MNYDIEKAMSNFRLASRGLFNNYFIESENDLGIIQERFSDVQELLFEKLVTEPLDLSNIRYGDVNSEIIAETNKSYVVPAQINREINSGYWDYPLNEIHSDAVMHFVSFFDFNESRCLDNQYVQVKIAHWSNQLEAVGKHALIEYEHLKFTCS